MMLFGRLWAHMPNGVQIKDGAPAVATDVDSYWARHTVNSTPFDNAADSETYLQWRNAQYPLFPEFMDIWGNHAGETVLDFGCGPGNDLVGFLLYSDAAKVIGIDVSPKALDLARHRLELHRIKRGRVELIRTGDSEATIPLPADSVDYINCGGVLHHVSHPAAVLAEFHRVLRPSGRGRIMVYNRNSLWFHLYVAYIRQVLEGAFEGLPVDQAFARSTDGEDCPISVPYTADEFLALLHSVGFRGRFVGGYLSRFEIDCWNRHGTQAANDPRLATEHRSFLGQLAWDAKGMPLYHGKHAGIGGVYEIFKD